MNRDNTIEMNFNPAPGFTGRALRDDGIQRALDNESEIWKAAFKGFYLSWIASKPKGFRFLFEEVRRAAALVIGNPHHSNVWGGISNYLVDSGTVVVVQLHQQAKSLKSHAHKYQLYEKV